MVVFLPIFRALFLCPKTMTNTDAIDKKVAEELDRTPKKSIIHLFDCLIEKAQATGASDIHIDPGQNRVRVRLRIDGVLQDVYEFPKTIHAEVISRIKVVARLRTDEHQATQDGRFRHVPAEDPNSYVD